MGTSGRRKRNKSELSSSADVNHRDWKRIHHSPLFWIGALLFAAAVAIYLL